MNSTAVMTHGHLLAGRVARRAEVYGIGGSRRVLRPVRPADVHAIIELVRPCAKRRVLTTKGLISYFGDIQEFTTAEEIPGVVRPSGADNGDIPAISRIVSYGALRVMWDDTAEVCTPAAHPDTLGTRLDSAILRGLIAQARKMGFKRVFCTTFEGQFFGAHGFKPIESTPVDADVFTEILRSHDDGLVEFLDLVHVRPSTLSNAHMLLHL